jgi:hypothetical protein
VTGTHLSWHLTTIPFKIFCPPVSYRKQILNIYKKDLTNFCGYDTRSVARLERETYISRECGEEYLDQSRRDGKYERGDADASAY